MKKKLVILATGLLTVALSAAVFANKPQDAEKSLLMRNVEAIAQGEDDITGLGRYRTVACESNWFGHWKTYCCPHDFYSNCPDSGTCGQTPVQGCD